MNDKGSIDMYGDGFLEYIAANPEVIAPEEDDAAPPATLVKMVDEMLELKKQVEMLEDDLTTLKQRYDDVRKRQLPDLMQTLGLVGPDGKARFTHQSGARVHLTHKVRASYTKSAEEVFFAWLRKNGHGALIKETVHPQTLQAFAKELIENGDQLPPELFAHTETMAVITIPKKGETQ